MFPLFLNLQERLAVVVGGGSQGKLPAYPPAIFQRKPRSSKAVYWTKQDDGVSVRVTLASGVRKHELRP